MPVRRQSASPRLSMGSTDSFVVWVALRLAAGLASAWVLISVSAWCLDTLAVYQRPFLNSLVFAGVGGGIAVAGLLCIALTYRQAGSKHAWIALGLLALMVSALIWQFFVRYSADPTSVHSAPSAFR
jgi:MFS family permease